MYTLLSNLIARDVGASPTTAAPAISHTTVVLLIVLLVLLVLALFMIAGLLFVRHRRRNSKSHLLPVYNEKRFSTSSNGSSSHRRVMVRPAEAVYVLNEKQDLIKNSSSPPPSPLPEIRITFPEEYDDSGKRQSGRVVVVRMGEHSVGLEPVEGLPEYRQISAERFHSIDLDRVGGLVEKARNSPHGVAS